MTTTIMRAIFKPKALAIAVALGCTAQAQAVSFNIGEIEGQFDSSLSLGASFATQNSNQGLVGIVNGGKGQSSTGDDNRLNFKKGDAFSEIFKGVHDLQLKWGDSGIFVRGKYWYDFALENSSQDFKQVSDSGRKEAAKSSGYQLLDAFVYHNYTIADEPGTALDVTTQDEILRLLEDLVAAENLTLVLVTHDSALAALCDRQIRLRSGEIEAGA